MLVYEYNIVGMYVLGNAYECLYRILGSAMKA